MAFFEEFHKGPSLFPFLRGSSLEMSRLATSSSSALEAAASWSDKGCHHLVPDRGAGILETVDGEVATSGSPPTVAS